MLRTIVRANRWLSARFDTLLPASYSVDGNTDFLRNIVPNYLKLGLSVVDVGGGRHPCIDVGRKRALGLRVLGLDIDRTELDAAPDGAYESVVVADVSTWVGKSDADLVICQSLLEHVQGVNGAIHALSSMLRPGGVALIFVPSRNAAFARLNLLLPEAAKRSMLFAIYPTARTGQGFKSYYESCTPQDMEEIGASHGFEVVERRLYWCSEYFSFFLPLHILWRVWQVAFKATHGPQSAESFFLALRRRHE